MIKSDKKKNVGKNIWALYQLCTVLKQEYGEKSIIKKGVEKTFLKTGYYKKDFKKRLNWAWYV